MINSKVNIIKDRIEKALSPQYLEVLDESDQHIGHAGHQGGGRHFAVIVTAEKLTGLSKVAAHREIYALFADMMPEQIHALRIVVRK